MQKRPLLGLTLSELQNVVKNLGMPGFSAKQIASWLYDKKVTSIDEMSNLSLKHRELLKEIYEVGAEAPVDAMRSVDGTVKYLYRAGEGHFVEAVYIPDEDRATLCVSSQVGCKMNCKFCMTGKQGFTANLTSNQIINQINSLPERDKLTNVVMMGMGEPLLNVANVVPAMEIMLDDFAYGLSKRRVTLSTSGVVPALDMLRDKIDVALAISLHAPNDELRDEIMPINKKYNIKMLMDSVHRYLEVSNANHGKVTIEYVLLDHVNDGTEHAHQLAQVLKNTPCKINLIPWNPFPEAPYGKSSNSRVDRFQKTLMEYGFTVIVRKTRGDDIDAACGQLAGDVIDRTKRTAMKRKFGEGIDVKAVN